MWQNCFQGPTSAHLSLVRTVFWGPQSRCVGAFSGHLHKETTFSSRVSQKIAQGIFAMESLEQIVKNKESCDSSTCIEP